MGIVMGTDQEENSIAVNGVTMRYAVTGEGRPVVLAHGNGEDHHLFELLIQQLAEAGYRVYAPDSRGHDASRLEALYCLPTRFMPIIYLQPVLGGVPQGIGSV